MAALSQSRSHTVHADLSQTQIASATRTAGADTMISTEPSEITHSATRATGNAANKDDAHNPSYHESNEQHPTANRAASRAPHGCFADPHQALRLLFAHVKSLYGHYENLTDQLANLRRIWEQALSYRTNTLPRIANPVDPRLRPAPATPATPPAVAAFANFACRNVPTTPIEPQQQNSGDVNRTFIEDTFFTEPSDRNFAQQPETPTPKVPTTTPAVSLLSTTPDAAYKPTLAVCAPLGSPFCNPPSPQGTPQHNQGITITHTGPLNLTTELHLPPTRTSSRAESAAATDTSPINVEITGIAANYRPGARSPEYSPCSSSPPTPPPTEREPDAKTHISTDDAIDILDAGTPSESPSSVNSLASSDNGPHAADRTERPAQPHPRVPSAPHAPPSLHIDFMRPLFSMSDVGRNTLCGKALKLLRRANMPVFFNRLSTNSFNVPHVITMAYDEEGRVVGILVTAYVRPSLVSSNMIGYLLAPIIIAESKHGHAAAIRQCLARDLHSQAASLHPTPMVLLPTNQNLATMIDTIESAPDRLLTTGWRAPLKPEVFHELARFYWHTELHHRLRTASQHTLLYPSHLVPGGRLAPIPHYVRDHDATGYKMSGDGYDCFYSYYGEHLVFFKHEQNHVVTWLPLRRNDVYDEPTLTAFLRERHLALETKKRHAAATQTWSRQTRPTTSA